MRFLAPVVALAAGAALLAPAAATAAVSPPRPTGDAPVGFTRITLTDTHRTERLVAGGGPRLIPLRVWYPASSPGAAPGEVFTTAEREAFESGFGLPPESLSGMGSTSTEHAPPTRRRHPVLLLSHGFGLTTALHTALATDLASHGYVVVGIDHPGDAELVDVGGGHLERLNPAGGRVRARSARERVADVRFVLDHLAAIHGAGRLDRTRIGALGHSLGGATAASAMLADTRIDAALDIDGAVTGRVVAAGLDRPFGALVGEFPLPAYEGLATLRRHVRAPHPFERMGTTGHQAFTDIVWLVPQLHADPSAFALGTVEPGTAVRQQRRFVRGFFDRYLTG